MAGPFFYPRQEAQSMHSPAADIARRLAEDAEAVCRHYLTNGRKQGRYWIVGDVLNTPGRSLYVRLSGPNSGPGAAGKWTEHVAAGVMLWWLYLALFWRGFGEIGQHNLSTARGFS
jgi:hypothetical protein